MKKIKSIISLSFFSISSILVASESSCNGQKRPREEELHYADATVDVAFKEMMWKEDNDPVAKSFIQTFVPEVQIESLEMLKTESLAIPALKQRGKKQTFMDFHVKAKNGHHYIVEMQSQRHIRFDERALFYTCSTYSRELDEKAFADESWYRN